MDKLELEKQRTEEALPEFGKLKITGPKYALKGDRNNMDHPRMYKTEDGKILFVVSLYKSNYKAVGAATPDYMIPMNPVYSEKCDSFYEVFDSVEEVEEFTHNLAGKRIKP